MTAMLCKERCGGEQEQEQGTNEKVTIVQERDSSGLGKNVMVKMRSWRIGLQSQQILLMDYTKVARKKGIKALIKELGEE